MSFISVVVPFHGVEPWLAQCIDALLTQRYPAGEYEVIFVDNGGAETARSLIRGQSRLRLLTETQQGAYAARNAGVRAARGELIAFTDADCAPAPDWLETIAHGLADPAIHILSGSYLPARRSFTAATLAAYENEKNRYIFSSQDDGLYYGYTNNMATRAWLFDEIGPFLPRLRGSDAIFVHRVVERFGRDCARFLPTMAVRHLEVGGALDYYRKVFVHSRSLRALGTVVPIRSLTLEERVHVFSRTVRMGGHSPIAAAALFLLLAGGLLAWYAGGLARVRDPRD